MRKKSFPHHPVIPANAGIQRHQPSWMSDQVGHDEGLNLKILRQQICQQRKNLSPDTQADAANKVANQLCNTEIFKNSQHIAAYFPINGELDPTLLMGYAWQAGKICYFPVIAKNQQLLFALYNEGDPLTRNRYGILEPYIEKNQIIAPQDLDIVITPLVAFDNKGNRLGMGSGYYDHTFAFLKQQTRPSKPYLIGIACEFQKVAELIPNSWDVRLDMVVTEAKIYAT